MAKQRSHEEDTSPSSQRDQPSIVPRGSATTGSSYDHILLMLADIKKEIGCLDTKTDRLISDVASHNTKIDELRHQATFIKGGMAVAAVVFAVVSWILSDKWSAVAENIQALEKLINK